MAVRDLALPRKEGREMRPFGEKTRDLLVGWWEEYEVRTLRYIQGYLISCGYRFQEARLLAQDLVSETFIHAGTSRFRHTIGTVNGDAWPWIKVIAYRRTVDALRRAGRPWDRVSLDDPDSGFAAALRDSSPTPDEYVLSAAVTLDELLRQGTITRDEMDLLLDYYAAGLKSPEIALLRQTSDTAMRQRISRLRRKIGEALNGHKKEHRHHGTR